MNWRTARLVESIEDFRNSMRDFMKFFRAHRKRQPIRHARKICICGKEVAVCKDGKFYKHICTSDYAQFGLEPIATSTGGPLKEIHLTDAQADQQDGRR